MIPPFPFHDHLTLAQVRAFENLREKYPDCFLLTHKIAAIIGVTRTQLEDYTGRNPRRPKEAA